LHNGQVIVLDDISEDILSDKEKLKNFVSSWCEKHKEADNGK